MLSSPFVLALIGGVLIGSSASLLLLLKGRIFGVSGILAGVLVPSKGDTAWRIAVLLGLMAAGGLFAVFWPSALPYHTNSGIWRYVVAGLLVGFGTQLGSGCTSGHGVCGISRMSPRSILATSTFIGSGIVTVLILRLFGALS